MIETGFNMGAEINKLIEQLLIFFVMMCVGFVGMKIHLLTSAALDATARMISKIMLPAMLLTSIPTSAGANFVDAMPILCFAIVLMASLYGLGSLTAKMAGLTDNQANIQKAMCTFGNIGFFGIPLLIALYGAQGAFTLSIYTIGDQLVLWTFGVYLTYPVGVNREGFDWKKLISPTTCALAAGLILLAFRCNPAGNFLWDSVVGLGNCSKYLAMIYIGGTAAEIPFRSIFTKKGPYFIALAKLLIFPILLYPVLRLLPFMPQTTAKSLMIIAGLPSMTTIAVLARSHGSDSAHACQCVVLTSLLSLVTLPTVLFIASLIG